MRRCYPIRRYGGRDTWCVVKIDFSLRFEMTGDCWVQMVRRWYKTKKPIFLRDGLFYKNSATTYSPAIKQYHRLSRA